MQNLKGLGRDFSAALFIQRQFLHQMETLFGGAANLVLQQFIPANIYPKPGQNLKQYVSQSQLTPTATRSYRRMAQNSFSFQLQIFQAYPPLARRTFG